MIWNRVRHLHSLVKTKEQHMEKHGEEVDFDFYKEEVIDFTNVKIIQICQKKKYIHGNINLRGEAKNASSKLRDLVIWGSKEQEEVYYWVCQIDGITVCESHGDSLAGYNYVKKAFDFYVKAAKEQSEILQSNEIQ